MVLNSGYFGGILEGSLGAFRVYKGVGLPRAIQDLPSLKHPRLALNPKPFKSYQPQTLAEPIETQKKLW